MKKTIYITLTVLVSLILASCQKINQGLTRLPLDDVTPENYFQNASQCAIWMNRSYYNFVSSSESWQSSTDDCYLQSVLSSYQQGTRLSTSSYQWDWGDVRRINVYFQYHDNCTDVESRKRYDGEAYLFRAWAYFNKVRVLGDVPWYEEVIGSTDEDLLRKPRDPRGYVMLKIIDDLDRAIEYLPTERDCARMTRWSALLLKSRFCLFEGTWRRYHNDDEFTPKNDPTEWTDWKTGEKKSVNLNDEYFLKLAAEAAEEVIDNSGYKIYNDDGKTMSYRNLFCSDDAKSDEVMLAHMYNYAQLKHGYSTVYYYTTRTAGFSRRFVNHYLCSDGTAFTSKSGHETTWFLDEVKDRDPRLSQTIMCPGYVQMGETVGTINDLQKTCTGYKPIKFTGRKENCNQGSGTADCPTLRYAEVLLCFAEAKAELGTLTQSDLDKSINQLRDRVGMPHLQIDCALDSWLAGLYHNYVKSPSSQKALILEVRRERTVEMVLEGRRMYDLFRWCEGSLITNRGSYDGTINEKTVSGGTAWYGVYVPKLPSSGSAFYDMDGDGANDFELYRDKQEDMTCTGCKISDLKLYNPSAEKGQETTSECGYITAFRDDYFTFREDRDYLSPISEHQIALTEGALEQNPNW